MEIEVFQPGQRVKFKGGVGYAAKKGDKATVVEAGRYYVDVVWDQPHVQMNGSYFPESFESLKANEE